MTLADILIPLAGSISNERAIKMREACDALEAKIDIAQRGSNYAHDLISSLTERVTELECDNLDRRLTKLESAVDVLDRERVETLNLRVNGLESMVLELGDATKNIALHTDETLRAVRGGGCTCTHEKRLHANATDGCLVSGCRCETYTGEGRAEEALSGNGRDQERAQPVRAAPPGAQALDVAGEGREPSRQAAPSPAPSVPANATGEVPEWMPSAEEMDRLWAQTAAGCILRGVAGSGAAWSAVIDLIASRAPDAPVSVVTMRMYCPYCGWLGEKRSNHSESNADALAHAETCELNPRRAMERRIAELESAPAAPRNTPSPASSVPAPATGEVPAWIPSVEEMLELIDDGREGDLISLIAIRAPAAPVVDVRRLLADYWMPALESNMDNEERMTRALAAQGVKCKEVQT